jgi:hypothetical protein
MTASLLANDKMRQTHPRLPSGILDMITYQVSRVPDFFSGRGDPRSARHMATWHGTLLGFRFLSLVRNVTNPVVTSKFHTIPPQHECTKDQQKVRWIVPMPKEEVVLGFEPRFPVFWSRHDKMPVSKTNVLTTTLYNRRCPEYSFAII